MFQEPEATRRCQVYSNMITLNLFALNCLVCRFCQTGQEVPMKLKSYFKSKSEYNYYSYNINLSSEEDLK